MYRDIHKYKCVVHIFNGVRNMSIHTYMSDIHITIHPYEYMSRHEYIYTCIYVYLYTYICIYIYIYICMNVWVLPDFYYQPNGKLERQGSELPACSRRACRS